ncbi:hypothetical protein [Salibacterium aidingense]|uniref:hypothetical protein n=1 Tax=Salibacterium aidingense TaxID=384933 RepID=UPI00042912B9|nr:hypothetical protein [Salibacterium aidingense]
MKAINNVRVFEKDWGREVYVDSAKEAVQYLEKKGEQAAVEAINRHLETVRTGAIKEYIISEDKQGDTFEVGSSMVEAFSYTTIYKK